MRAFLAIELPEPARRALSELQAALRRCGTDVKWVEPQNLHLTIRFLGDIGDPQRAQVEAVGVSATAAILPVTARLLSIGAFPSVAAPRVVWAGLSEGAGELGGVADQIEHGLVTQGFAPADHPFSPHITLGRVRSPRNRAQLTAALRETVWTPPEPFVMDHLTLFRSELSSTGPRYTVVSTFTFGGR